MIIKSRKITSAIGVNLILLACLFALLISMPFINLQNTSKISAATLTDDGFIEVDDNYDNQQTVNGIVNIYNSSDALVLSYTISNGVVSKSFDANGSANLVSGTGVYTVKIICPTFVQITSSFTLSGSSTLSINSNVFTVDLSKLASGITIMPANTDGAIVDNTWLTSY